MGEWAVIVKDTEVNEHGGFFVDWRLNLWGEAQDGSKQPLHPLPDEHDDDHPYEDAHVATTSVAPAPTKTAPPANPDEHHDRPVNQKPPEPEPTDSPDDKFPAEELESTNGTATTPATSPTATPSSSNYLSSYLPTFGASKRTQVWIYASLAMIIVFFIGLGVFFQLQRLKRRRTSPQDDYEFEMIEDEDEMDAMNGSGRTQRRGGELYNAFAGASDEEIFSDDDNDEPYRDRLANIPEKADEENSHLLSEKH